MTQIAEQNRKINTDIVCNKKINSGKANLTGRLWRIIRKICSILIILYMICCVLFLCAFAVPQFFGYESGIVQSGSMEPAIHVGSMIYYKDIDPETIQVGDVIAYQAAEEVTVTHRVIEISEENQTFKTKGDNNETADLSEVSFSRLLGRIEFTFPYGGYIYVWVMQYRAVLFAAACMIISMGSVAVRMIRT